MLSVTNLTSFDQVRKLQEVGFKIKGTIKNKQAILIMADEVNIPDENFEDEQEDEE